MRPYEDAISERLRQAEGQRDALLAAIEETRTARSLDFADDEHDPDGSLTSLDQARDVALLHQTEQTLADLVAARHRLVDGSYGLCESCRGEIASARLLARPEAVRCLACAGAAGGRRRGAGRS